MSRDSYYSAGSEDFRGYVWQIPELASLEERREIHFDRWAAESPETIGGLCHAPGTVC